MIRKISIAISILAVLFCVVGAIVAIVSDSGADPAPDRIPSQAPSQVRAIGKSPAPKVVIIDGDDIVQIGTDAPAGTYRTADKIEPGSICYWMKSNDAEGSDIIDNDIPSGGRPQVTLKKGQWFTSRGCPDWAKQ